MGRRRNAISLLSVLDKRHGKDYIIFIVYIFLYYIFSEVAS